MDNPGLSEPLVAVTRRTPVTRDAPRQLANRSFLPGTVPASGRPLARTYVNSIMGHIKRSLYGTCSSRFASPAPGSHSSPCQPGRPCLTHPSRQLRIMPNHETQSTQEDATAPSPHRTLYSGQHYVRLIVTSTRGSHRH